MSATRADRITDPWGERTPYGAGEPWPVRVDVQLADGVAEADVDRWVPAASILHSNGDGQEIAVKDGRIVGVRGAARDRVNHGRLGPKDLFGWQANAAPDRLTRPLIRDAATGELTDCDWETAMEAVVARSRALLAQPDGARRIAFYTSGQLFLEEYYTLAVIGKAGLGTPHMDGNTRLCTATAAASLRASFGTDGQPASYADVDHCDALALWGHNVAETQAVLWMRMLDRLHGRDRPRLLCVDPRRTPVAREAEIHLAPRPGTNLALMNGLLREVIDRGWIDEAWIDRHTLGFERLVATVAPCTAAQTASICDVAARDVEAAAELVGTCERLLSTVLQGFYQSHQATAAACQVDNLHLLRGMIGRPGAGVCQMNGQPTAQNTRETGADGDMPGMRNWENEAHVRELAEIWNVEPDRIPHDRPPTHAMEIWRRAEAGEIELLWISATNPAVSLPELGRIRAILRRPRPFVVVQDIFLTETAMLADVVLPAATWGEKRGTFTNADRTVHFSDRAVDPPGEARSDLAILLDYARRMDLRDRDGAPLVKWRDAEGAFEAWKVCSRGRPCDYSAMTHERLRREGPLQWPCTAAAPGGTERLYADGRFNTDPDYTETWGNDLRTGEPLGEEHARAEQPDGRAHLKALAYEPSPEAVSDDFPLLLTSGRTVTQFHTRTKTGRVAQLAAAAPEPWVELCADDARRFGIADGDRVRVASARGAIELPARIGDVRAGVAFVPFHYGYWDTDGSAPASPRHARAANELTATRWDAVSKQPEFKLAAVRVERIG